MEDFKPKIEKLEVNQDIQGLNKCLKHQNKSVRIKASIAICYLAEKGIVDSSSIPLLAKLIFDPDERVQWISNEALEMVINSIDNEELSKVLEKFFDENLQILCKVIKAFLTKNVDYDLDDSHLKKNVFKYFHNPNGNHFKNLTDYVEDIKPQRFETNLMINEYSLKVEKQNAKAMIEGFKKNNELYYVTIYTAHKYSKSIQNNFEKIPKLLTLKVSSPRKEYPLSDIGDKLDASNYHPPLKYIAVLDTKYYIRNNIELWNNLCSIGIFDIWEPEAPFNSLQGKDDQMILLFRIFEIDIDLKDEVIKGQYFDTLKGRKVKIVKPIIPSNNYDNYAKNYDGKYYFNDIQNILTINLSDYLIREEKICNTSNLYK